MNTQRSTTMQYANLGNTGTKVSRICIGGFTFGNKNEWEVRLDPARLIINRALDLGITFFDTANEYSQGRSEEIVGECLKGARDDVIIATKVFYPMGSRPNQRGLSRIHILQQIKGSLERLQTDYVDLYQTHRWDYETPIEETLRALDNLVQKGKVRYIGGSTMYAWEFAKALFTSDRLGLERFTNMQNHYNLVYREEEREMNPLCEDQNIPLIPYSPLAGGFLTGQYKREETVNSPRSRFSSMGKWYFHPNDFDILDRLIEMATEKDVKPAQLALAWILHRKNVAAPIIAASRVEHVDDAVEALEIKLSPDDMNRLEELYQPHFHLGIE